MVASPWKYTTAGSTKYTRTQCKHFCQEKVGPIVEHFIWLKKDLPQEQKQIADNIVGPNGELIQSCCQWKAPDFGDSCQLTIRYPIDEVRKELEIEKNKANST